MQPRDRADQRNHTLRRQRYQLKRTKKKKRYRNQYRYYHPVQPSHESETLAAPRVFNLRNENCVEVIKFIKTIKKTARSGKGILIDLKDVVDIKEGAIAMLLSVMREVGEEYHTSIGGTLPDDADARRTIERSGFYKFVRAPNKATIDSGKNELRTGYWNTKTGFLGESVRSAMETVWGMRGRNPEIHGSIFEMMRNSVDHAFPKAQRTRWHLSIIHDEENNLVKFSFVDNGTGILNSMKKSKLRLLWYRFVDGADIIDTAFHGGMESRTGLKWRGKGLPFIFENYSEKLIKNFLVITNNVFIHYDNDVKRLLPVSFDGTYYYWEVDTTCTKACFD